MTRLRLLVRPALACVVLSAVVCLVVYGLALSGALESVELRGYDLLLSRRALPPPPPELVIVDFDDATDRAFGTFPIPRRLLADVLNKISGGEPELIGLDILLDEPRASAEDDLRVASALASASNVILADSFGTKQLPPSQPLGLFRQHAIGTGFVNVPVDNDGLIRRTMLWMRMPIRQEVRIETEAPRTMASAGTRLEEATPYEGFSFSLMLASAYLAKRPEPRIGSLHLGDIEIPYDDTSPNTALIGYWNLDGIPRVSVVELMAPGFNRGILRGKIVLVGQSGTRAKDLYATSVFRFRSPGERRLISGLEIHAAALATILTGKTIRVLGSQHLWTLNFLFAILAIALVIAVRPAYSVLVVAGGLLGIYLLAQVLLSGGNIWMKFVSTEAGTLLAVTTGLGYRFLEERRLRFGVEIAHRQEAEQRQRLERELTLARSIQQSLLPHTTPMVEGFDIAVRYESSLQVGGDYYDFVPLDNSQLLLVVADVKGKGVAAALVMSNLQAILHGSARQQRSLQELAVALNDGVQRNYAGEQFITMFLGLLDAPRRELRYVNAGHVPPVVVHPGAEASRLTDGGMVIGLFPGMQYSSGVVQLQPGDIFLACTDGITEADDISGIQFEMAGMIRVARIHSQDPADKIVDAILAEVQAFSTGGAHEDDMVAMVLKVL